MGNCSEEGFSGSAINNKVKYLKKSHDTIWLRVRLCPRHSMININNGIHYLWQRFRVSYFKFETSDNENNCGITKTDGEKLKFHIKGASNISKLDNVLYQIPLPMSVNTSQPPPWAEFAFKHLLPTPETRRIQEDMLNFKFVMLLFWYVIFIFLSHRAAYKLSEP